jgi:hypothetical protein
MVVMCKLRITNIVQSRGICQRVRSRICGGYKPSYAPSVGLPARET